MGATVTIKEIPNPDEANCDTQGMCIQMTGPAVAVSDVVAGFIEERNHAVDAVRAELNEARDLVRQFRAYAGFLRNVRHQREIESASLERELNGLREARQSELAALNAQLRTFGLYWHSGKVSETPPADEAPQS